MTDTRLYTGDQVEVLGPESAGMGGGGSPRFEGLEAPWTRRRRFGNR